jgi:hypothetical protein
MEPQYRFCTTPDGVRLAYAVLHHGPRTVAYVLDLASALRGQRLPHDAVVPKGFEEPVRLYEVRWRE